MAERRPIVILPTGHSELPIGDTLPRGGDSFGITIVGGDAEIELGYKAIGRAKCSGTILSYRIDSYESGTNSAIVGSISINVKKNGSLLGVASLSAASTILDSVLSGWTTSFSSGDLLQYEVTSNSGIKNLTLTLFF
jgi:hypothetical protein